MITLNEFLRNAQELCDQAVEAHRKSEERPRPLTFAEEVSMRTQAAIGAVEAFAAYQRALFEPITLVVDESTARALIPSMRQGDESNRPG